MPCKTKDCPNTVIKSTKTETHRFCVQCRDRLVAEAKVVVDNLVNEVKALRDVVYNENINTKKTNKWKSINAGYNDNYQTIIGGTQNPYKVEPEVFYHFKSMTKTFRPSVTGILAKHVTCKYGGETILVHVAPEKIR